MMSLVFLSCFAFIIIACIELVIISRLNQLLKHNEETIFILENEKNALKYEIQDLAYKMQTTKTKPKKQEKVVPTEKVSNKRGRKLKTKKEN